MAGFGITGAVVAIGEACMDGGEIAVEAEPGKRLVRDGQLDVLASARPAGRGYRLVAVKRRLAGRFSTKSAPSSLRFGNGSDRTPTSYPIALVSRGVLTCGTTVGLPCWKLISVCSASTFVSAPRKSLL